MGDDFLANIDRLRNSPGLTPANVEEIRLGLLRLGRVMCIRCVERAVYWRSGVRREPFCHPCARDVPGVYELINTDAVDG